MRVSWELFDNFHLLALLFEFSTGCETFVDKLDFELLFRVKKYSHPNRMKQTSSRVRLHVDAIVESSDNVRSDPPDIFE